MVAEGESDDYTSDVFVLGLQESVVDQSGAAVGNARKVKQVAKGSIGISSSLDKFWTDCVADALGDGWCLVSLQTLGEMRLLVWAPQHFRTAAELVSCSPRDAGAQLHTIG